MRRIERITLSPETMIFLWERRLRVVEAGEKATGDRRDAQYQEADKLWGGSYNDNRAFDEVRAALRAMSPGHEYCMYCEHDHGRTIDHFCPKEKDPTLAFAWNNYFWTCFECNSVFKGTQFPKKNGLPLLVNPERDEPREHLQFSPRDGKLVGCTDKGIETVKVLGFDRRGNLDKTRRAAWRNVQRLIVDYADACAKDDDERARAAQLDLCCHPHASLLHVLLELVDKPGGHLLLEEKRCVAILADYPEIRSWA